MVEFQPHQENKAAPDSDPMAAAAA